jgi:microsomal dipeptidase-like Zn-dependent dipeptidase
MNSLAQIEHCLHRALFPESWFIDGLVRRGYSDTDIELIFGGNFRRVLGQIWNAKS